MPKSARSAPARTPSAAAVPPAPEPVRVEEPPERVVWEQESLRLVARDYADGRGPHYEVQAQHGWSWWAPPESGGALWVPATGEEWTLMFNFLAAARDEHSAQGEGAQP